MSRRFIPPSVATFLDGPLSDTARSIAAARDESYAEGLANGRREGHAAGLREGISQSQEARALEMANLENDFAKQHAVGCVLAAFEKLLAAQDTTRHTLERETLDVMIAALRALFPLLLARAQGAEIAALVCEALSEHRSERVSLRASPDTIGLVKAAGPGELDTSRLTLLPDPDMAPGSAVATWTGAGLSFDPAALLEQVTGVLSRISAHDKETVA
jgi:flagellar biosynthesis/type III secretory pathway protein FliH